MGDVMKDQGQTPSWVVVLIGGIIFLFWFSMSQSLDRIGQRLDRMDAQLDRVEKRLEEQYDHLEDRVFQLEANQFRVIPQQ